MWKKIFYSAGRASSSDRARLLVSSTNLTGGTTGLPTFYAPGVNISSSTPRHSHSHSQQHLHESRTPSAEPVAICGAEICGPRGNKYGIISPDHRRNHIIDKASFVTSSTYNLKSQYVLIHYSVIHVYRKYDPYPIESRTMVSCFRQFDIWIIS